MSSFLRIGLIVMAVAVAGGLFIGATDHPDTKVADDDDAPSPAAKSSDGAAPSRPNQLVVTLDRGGQEKGGIESSKPASKPYQDVVRVYGSVVALDRLVTLYNTALTNDVQMQAARAKAEASRAADDRAQNMLKVFATAKAQAETASAAYAIDQSGLAAAKAQIDALRNVAIQDWGPTLGVAVAERDPLATDLVQHRTCLVQVSLPADAKVRAPARLAFRVDAADGAEGRLIAPAASVDSRLQGTAYLYAVPATAGFVSGASVTALIPKGEAEAGVDIPASAVVWTSGKPWIYVRTAPDTFERHAIDGAAAPSASGGYVLPAKTLPTGDNVVVAGAQVLLSQELRTQIPADEDDN